MGSYKKRMFQPPDPRRAGKKNLIKTVEGNLINQHGVTFTPEEKKALESAVNSVNRKMKRELEKAGNLPRLHAGKDTGDLMLTKYRLGDEPEFILAPRSKSMQRFTSKSQYNQYMRNLKQAMNKDYELYRQRLYKQNYTKALEREFGGKAYTDDIKMKIRMMKPKDFVNLVNSDDAMEIKFVYSPDEAGDRLNAIRSALGMKQRDLEGEYEE